MKLGDRSFGVVTKRDPPPWVVIHVLWGRDGLVCLSVASIRTAAAGPTAACLSSPRGLKDNPLLRAGPLLPDDFLYLAAGTGGALRIGSGSVSTATRGSHSSQLGRYQFQSPSSFMLAGSKTPRMIVASIKTAAAKPTPQAKEGLNLSK